MELQIWKMLTLVVSSLIATSAPADTLFTIAESSGDQVKMSRLWVDHGRYRLESTVGDEHGLEIFNDGKLYLLNSREKTYTVLDRERLARDAAVHREWIERSSSTEQTASRRELRQTEGVKLTGTQACRVWEVLVNNELQQEICVLPLKALKTGIIVRKTMDRYNELLAEFDASTPSMPWSDVETTEGIPISVVTYARGKVHSSSVTVSINTAEVAAPKRYELPPGMREVLLK